MYILQGHIPINCKISEAENFDFFGFLIISRTVGYNISSLLADLLPNM